MTRELYEQALQECRMSDQEALDALNFAAYMAETELRQLKDGNPADADDIERLATVSDELDRLYEEVEDIIEKGKGVQE